MHAVIKCIIICLWGVTPSPSYVLEGILSISSRHVGKILVVALMNSI